MKNHVYALLVALMVVVGGTGTAVAGTGVDCLKMFAGETVSNPKYTLDSKHCSIALGYWYIDYATAPQKIVMYYNAQLLGIVIVDYDDKKPVPAPPLVTSVTDFGLARVQPGSTTGPSVAQSGSNAGGSVDNHIRQRRQSSVTDT